MADKLSTSSIALNTKTEKGPVPKMSPTTSDAIGDVVVAIPRNKSLKNQPLQKSLEFIQEKTEEQIHMAKTSNIIKNSASTINKRSSTDFIFGKVIGEGSFSTVYLAKDVHTNKEYAIKVCEKRHIVKEKKVEYIKREKEVLNMLSEMKHLFVRLFCTFQDSDRLYFVLSYAKNGELLPYINKVGSFDIECTKFYSAEILRGLEYLHALGIIHRDLKPENILLDDNMHILITDFGSAKVLQNKYQQNLKYNGTHSEEIHRERRNSFVGTAQYVSPELLTSKSATQASDLWAFGCIIYQMVAGLPPFRSRSEYLIFQKILNLKYEIPDGFDELARDLISKLIVLNPLERLGATDEHPNGYLSIRSHSFFDKIEFETLHTQTPPPIYPYLPGTSEHEEMRSHYRVPDNLEPGLDDKQLTRLLGLELSNVDEKKTFKSRRPEEIFEKQNVDGQSNKNKIISIINQKEFDSKLEQQKASNQWNSFVEGNLIVKQGFVNKRKGLFARKRMLLLTTGPHLYYVDPFSMQLKGEIPWSKELRVEPKNFKIFFVHTPNRTYYLDDPQGYALEWCQAIEDVRVHYYDSNEASSKKEI